ncbi:helicase HerA domain-containing protein [Pseudalkalibacillus sp. A8]|uniref:helicase HerA domain-containing protein n=1 Tax=Pseudalkalibacillus sp. A8 TaxID=3382641 RepID=UPI0038B5AD54
MVTKGKEEELKKLTKVFLKSSPLWGSVVGYFYLSNNPEVVTNLYPYIQKGIGALAIGGTCLLGGAITRHYTTRKKEKTQYKYFRMIPHIEQRNNPTRIREMIEQFIGYRRPFYIRFLKGREWFQWLIHKDENEEISFYIGCPGDRQTGIIKTLENAYPEAEFHKVEGIPLSGSEGSGGRMTFSTKGLDKRLPLIPFEGIDGIGNMVSFMEKDTWIDVTFSPGSNYKIRRKLRKAEKAMRKDYSKISDMDSYEKERFKAISTRLSGRDESFHVSVSILGSSKATLYSIANSIGTMMNGENRLILRKHSKPIKKCPYPMKHVMDWTGQELEQMVHLPDMRHDAAEDIPHLEKGERNLNKNEFSHGITIGKMKHPFVKDREVKIPDEIFKQHFALTGKTGAGKSALALTAIQSMIDAWIENPNKAPGFTLFDPAQETALTALNRLLKAETEGKAVPWEKVHYISMKESDFPVSLNLLHQGAGEDSNAVKNNIMDLLDTAFDNTGAPRMQKYLDHVVLSLLKDKRSHNILGVNRMTTDGFFRKEVLKSVSDPVLTDFWEKVNEKELRNVADTVYTRTSPFISSEYMRRIFGQSKFSFDLKRWMDEGHIVLVDIKGLSRIETTLIMGHLMTQYHQQATKRVTGSKFHMLFVDEAHLVQIPIMETIIAFDRKYSLGLGLMTQYMGQFQPWLRKAIGGNMGTIISGTQGDESAAQIEAMTNGKFSAEYLQDLPSLTAAVFSKYKGKNNQHKITTCTVVTDPPYVYKPDGETADYQNEKEMIAGFDWSREKARELQERDGLHYSKVDDQIAKYLGVDLEEVDEMFFECDQREDLKPEPKVEIEPAIEPEPQRGKVLAFPNNQKRSDPVDQNNDDDFF